MKLKSIKCVIASAVLLCGALTGIFASCATGGESGVGGKTTLLKYEESDLLVALVDYLKDLNADHDMPPTSFSAKIDQIKGGKQALYADFNSSESYFVGGYYNGGHSDEESLYCCAHDYTWVSCESADAIGESYGGKKFIVAFQINAAASVEDIVYADKKAPEFEHFQLYYPKFKNGLNGNSSVAFDEAFIYLNSSDNKIVYYSTSAYNNAWVTLPCVSLGGQPYIAVDMYVEYSDGSCSEVNLEAEFGEYYGALMNLIQTDKYSAGGENGSTVFYGLFNINDLVNGVIK